MNYSLSRAARVRTVGFAALLVFAMWAPAAQTDATDYIHYQLGVKYKSEGGLDRAVEEFRKVLAAYPDNYNAYLHLAEIHRDQGRSNLAVYDLQKALTFNPGWGRAHRMLAQVYENDKQISKAIAELQTYQEICDPAERDSLQREINRLLTRQDAVRPATAVAPTPVAPAPAVPGAPASAASTGVGSASAPPLPKPKVSSASAARIDEEFGKAITLYGQKRFDEALIHLRACLAMNPSHSGAYYYAGMIRRRMNQNVKAAYNFERALAYPELGYNAHFYLGKIRGEQGDYAAAVKHLKAYVQASSNEGGKREAASLIARYSESSGKPVPVASHAAAAGEDSAIAPPAPAPQSPEPELAPLEVRLDSMLVMVVVDTLSEAGRAMLDAVGLFTSGKYDAAITEFKKVLVSYASNASVAAHCCYNIGICYVKLRLFAKAENQFQQILDRYPTHALAPAALFFKAITYAERKNSAEAEKLLRSFIQKHRQHAWIDRAYERLGDAYLDLEDPARAADAFTQAAALAQKPADRVVAGFKLGCVFLELQNWPRAESAFKKAIAEGEAGRSLHRVPDSYYRMADALYKQKRMQQALELYLKVTEKYPGFQESPWGYFQIGNIRKHLGEYRAAIDMYKKLMTDFPDDYWARQAKWKIDDATWEHEYRAVLR